MDTNIELSFIIPVYNVENYLKECLDSIITQEFACSFEIILVDDGSEDKSGLICDEYSTKYDYVKSFHQVNSGQSVARNTAIKKASGNYLCFVDSDDKICKGYIERIQAGIVDNVDVIAINAISSNRKCEYPFKPEYFEHGIEGYLLNAIKKFPIETVPWRFIVRKDFLEKNNLWFHDGIYHEDCEWCTKLLVCAKTICPIYEYLYEYRDSVTDGRKSTCNDKSLLNKRCECYKIVTDELIKYSKTFENDKIRKNYILRNAGQTLQQYFLLADEVNMVTCITKIETASYKYLYKYLGRKFCFCVVLFGIKNGSRYYKKMFRRKEQRW